MAQSIRMLAALLEDLGLFPASTTGLQSPVTQAPVDSTSSSGLSIHIFINLK